MVPTEARLFSAFHTVLCSGHLSQIIGEALYWCPAFGRHSVDISRSCRGQESVGQFRRILYIKKWLLRLMAQSFLLHARHWSFTGDPHFQIYLPDIVGRDVLGDCTGYITTPVWTICVFTFPSFSVSLVTDGLLVLTCCLSHVTLKPVNVKVRLLMFFTVIIIITCNKG